MERSTIKYEQVFVVHELIRFESLSRFLSDLVIAKLRKSHKPGNVTKSLSRKLHWFQQILNLHSNILLSMARMFNMMPCPTEKLQCKMQHVKRRLRRCSVETWSFNKVIATTLNCYWYNLTHETSSRLHLLLKRALVMHTGISSTANRLHPWKCFTDQSRKWSAFLHLMSLKRATSKRNRYKREK